MRILAVDPGGVRTGLAICDVTEILASPLGAIVEGNPEKLPDKITEAARLHQAEMIVIGHPKNMDGSEGESARRAAALADKLRAVTGLPVKLWDERMTTVSAIGYLNETNTRGKKRKAAVDTLSAVIILQNYLEFRRAAARRQPSDPG